MATTPIAISEADGIHSPRYSPSLGSGKFMLSTTASTAHPPGVGVSATCDHFMLMHVEQLARTSTTLSNAVQGLETRQVGLSERVSEVSGSVQGLQEEHLILASRQDMVAELVQQKFQEKEFMQLMNQPVDHPSSPSRGPHSFQRIGDLPSLEARLDDQERRLMKMGVDVHVLANRVASMCPIDVLRDGLLLDGRETSSLAERLIELEKGQKKVLVAAQKSLKMAVGLQQHYRVQLQRQDSATISLADSASDQFLHSCEDVSELREKVEELQQIVTCNLTANSPTKLKPGIVGELDESKHDTLMSMMSSMQERVDRSLQDMTTRLDSVFDNSDRRSHSACLKVCKNIPDINQRIDELWAQCQACASKVKAHDVHLRFLTTHAEEQKLLSLEIDDPTHSIEELVHRPVETHLRQSQKNSPLQVRTQVRPSQRESPPRKVQTASASDPQRCLAGQTSFSSNECIALRSSTSSVEAGAHPLLQKSGLHAIPALMDCEFEEEPPSPTASLAFSVSSTGAFSARSGRTMDTTMDTAVGSRNAAGTSIERIKDESPTKEAQNSLKLFGGSSIFNRCK